MERKKTVSGRYSKGWAKKARVLSRDASLPWKLYDVANKAWVGNRRAHKSAKSQRNSIMCFFR